MHRCGRFNKASARALCCPSVYSLDDLCPNKAWGGGGGSLWGAKVEASFA